MSHDHTVQLYRRIQPCAPHQPDRHQPSLHLDSLASPRSTPCGPAHGAPIRLPLAHLPYRGQFQRSIGLGPGLVLDNLTLECRETFTSAVTCPYHAWKHGKVLISTKNLMKKRGISWNFSDLAVRSQRGKSASRSVLTAKRSDLSAQRTTRAQLNLTGRFKRWPELDCAKCCRTLR